MTKKALVHHRGPDDVHEGLSWVEAVKMATALNKEFLRFVEEDPDSESRPYAWAIPYRSVEHFREEYPGWGVGVDQGAVGR